jgi:hypothetical protein
MIPVTHLDCKLIHIQLYSIQPALLAIGIVQVHQSKMDAPIGPHTCIINSTFTIIASTVYIPLNDTRREAILAFLFFLRASFSVFTSFTALCPSTGRSGCGTIDWYSSKPCSCPKASHKECHSSNVALLPSKTGDFKY